MGYVLQAFTAREPVLISSASGLTHARIVPLGCGFTMVPLTDTLFDEMNQAAIASGIPATPGSSWRYPEGVVWAMRWSSNGPISYVEADFFGGVGSQGAVVCRGGDAILGPTHSANYSPGVREPTRSGWVMRQALRYLAVRTRPGRNWPINQALRCLGVRNRRGQDEFDTVDLGRYRETEEWLGESI